MVAKKKAPSYTPIGESISIESAYIQAVTAMDLAAEIAQDKQDSETLLRVAELYIAMGNNLIPRPDGEEEEDEEIDELVSDVFPPVGFGPATPREVAKDDER